MHLWIDTTVSARNVKVASWEEAVAHCQKMDRVLQEHGLDIDYKATFVDDDGTSSRRKINEDGSVYWEEVK
jgi:hypothetical protein